MRIVLISLVVALLVSPISCYAKSDSIRTSVDVPYLNLLSAPSCINIFLNENGSTTVNADSDTIKFSHNSSMAKKIVADVRPESDLSYLTLDMTINGTSITLVDSGKTLNNVTVLDNLGAGGYTEKVGWSATSSTTETTERQISLTIEFTTVDL